jgi:hypothetical protein
MTPRDAEGGDDLADAERARIDRRDRRRRPRMVVDNAGVKRLLGALARRRQQAREGREGPRSGSAGS